MLAGSRLCQWRIDGGFGKGCRGRALDKTHSLEILSEGATVILTPHGIHDMD